MKKKKIFKIITFSIIWIIIIFSYYIPNTSYKFDNNNITYKIADDFKFESDSQSIIQEIKDITNNIYDPVIAAQIIRDNAGVPANETVGIRNGKNPGCEGILSDSERILILSESDAQSLSTFGTGTKTNPYVIDNLKLDNSESSTERAGIYINDPNCLYYLKIDNCYISGYQNEQIYVNFGTKVKISNCTFTSGEFGIVCKGGNLFIYETLISGFQKGGIKSSASEKEEIFIRDTQFDNSVGSWGSNSRAISMEGTGCLSLKYVEINNVNETDFLYIYKTTKIIFTNCYINNCSSALLLNSSSKGFLDSTSTIKYLDIRNTSDDSIHLQTGSGIEISYCNLRDSAPLKRLIIFNRYSTKIPKNIRVHHCKFTDKSNSGRPGDECLEAWYGKNIEFDHNWITECSEDGFELAYPNTGCSIHDNVGDNVRKQIVDIYKTVGNIEHPSSLGGNVNTYIHHIYGNSIRDVAVRVTDANGVIVHDIYGESGGGPTVCLEQRHGEIGTTPANCRILGPITNQSINGLKCGFEGEIGPNNIFIDFKTNTMQIKYKEDEIFLNDCLFSVNTNNNILVKIFVINFSSDLSICENTVMEWYETNEIDAVINYMINFKTPWYIFQLKYEKNGDWFNLSQFITNVKGTLYFSTQENFTKHYKIVFKKPPYFSELNKIYFYLILLGSFGIVSIFSLLILKKKKYKQ